MKFFTGCVAAAALALAAGAGQAQVLAQGPVHNIAGGGVIPVSDLDGPYAPDAAPPPRYGYGYDAQGPAPVLLPSTEVYAVLRDNGFSPLGIPRLRGGVYAIAAIDQSGEDGRVLIDARDGRILRFMPNADAYGMAPADEEPAYVPDRPYSALPPPTLVRGGPPRPPAPIPHVATRRVPLPKASPPRGEVPVAAGRPAEHQAAAMQAKPAETATPTVGQARPAPAILPTQDMPAAQGLD